MEAVSVLSVSVSRGHECVVSVSGGHECCQCCSNHLVTSCVFLFLFIAIFYASLFLSTASL